MSLAHKKNHGARHIAGGPDEIPGIGSGGGVTDHGALIGLADDDHPQYTTNAEATAIADAQAAAAFPGYDAPGDSAPGDVADEGAATSLARSDHTHGRTDDYGNPVAIGTANDGGSDVELASANHVHKLQGAAIQSATGDSASLATGVAGDVTVTWPTPFADANYKVALAFLYPASESTNRMPPTGYVKRDGANAPSASRIIVRVLNNSSVSEVVTVMAIAIHD